MNSSENIWRSASLTNLELQANEVHLWYASLDQPEPVIERLSQYLSQEERARAQRFHFARDQRRFTLGRGLLRLLLGKYMQIPPERVQFHYTAYGKPELAPSPAGAPLALHFNLSHSEELALYAFATSWELGIDVEYVRPIGEAMQIAEQYFLKQEKDDLRRLVLESQQDQRGQQRLNEQFFIYWTRMEAYLKARGDGMFGLDERKEVTSVAEQRKLAPWQIHDLRPAPGYVAALAIPERDAHIVCRQSMLHED